MIRSQWRATKITVKSPITRLEGENIMDLLAPSHLLLLLLVILVIFGPSKLGDVGGALGKGIRDFKRAINEPDNKFGEN
jgi:TatA/E family protein of Tat protein translocase